MLATKINLGSGRLEKMPLEIATFFATKDWINLGDRKLSNPKKKPLVEIDYSRTNYLPFEYNKWDKMQFEDNSISFIFSEHFLEHLFLDEAISLLRECRRILRPRGIMRIVVPDADLRPNPEMIGFPDINMPYTYPGKHKSRWSIYSLASIMETAGFKTNPLRYYNREGKLTDITSELNIDFYSTSPEKEVIKGFNMIIRRNSLIMDGLK